MSHKLIDIIDTSDMEISNWLRLNQEELSFNRIEEKNGIPQGTLSKVVKGTRPLPSKWIPVLTAVQKRMCGGKK